MTIGTARTPSNIEFVQCDGFDVFSPDGRVGVVDRLRFEHPDGGQVTTVLVVRVSLFGGRTVDVRDGDVIEIDVDRHRLSIGTAPCLVEDCPATRATERGVE